MTHQDTATESPTQSREEGDALLPELVAHLRAHRTVLRQLRAERITEAHLLLELVAAFEMTQRGFMEGQTTPE